MKYPKVVSRYCRTCKKHEKHKVSEVKARGRSATHPLSWGSAKRRGAKRGIGSHGKYSKPAISKFKMTGAKTSKKTNLKFTCEVCKKSSIQRKGFRTKKLVFE
ncbi:50S ribosomal protein L44e [archaeon]|nr:50S ribosomal protein L44e [archaeon]